jgi:hypothetical protein
LKRAAAEQDAGAAADAATIATSTVRKTTRCKPSSKGKHHAQERCGCKGCNKVTTYICSACTHTTDPAQKQFWFCNPTTVEGSKCFTKHVAKAHATEAHKDNYKGRGGGIQHHNDNDDYDNDDDDNDDDDDDAAADDNDDNDEGRAATT